METIDILMALLPIVFMLHDFEEIIMFKPWLAKNRLEIKRRFPKLDNLLDKKQIYNLSTSAFAVAVLHEFILISVAVFISLWCGLFYLWFAAFAAYSIHLLVHFLQWIVWRKYVPVIITSLLTLPYCIYTLLVVLNTIDLQLGLLLLWVLIGIVVTLLSFPSAFYFAFMFNNKPLKTDL